MELNIFSLQLIPPEQTLFSSPATCQLVEEWNFTVCKRWNVLSIRVLAADGSTLGTTPPCHLDENECRFDGMLDLRLTAEHWPLVFRAESHRLPQEGIHSIDSLPTKTVGFCVLEWNSQAGYSKEELFQKRIVTVHLFPVTLAEPNIHAVLTIKLKCLKPSSQSQSSIDTDTLKESTESNTSALQNASQILQNQQKDSPESLANQSTNSLDSCPVFLSLQSLYFPDIFSHSTFSRDAFQMVNVLRILNRSDDVHHLRLGPTNEEEQESLVHHEQSTLDTRKVMTDTKSSDLNAKASERVGKSIASGFYIIEPCSHFTLRPKSVMILAIAFIRQSTNASTYSRQLPGLNIRLLSSSFVSHKPMFTLTARQSQPTSAFGEPFHYWINRIQLSNLQLQVHEQSMSISLVESLQDRLLNMSRQTEPQPSPLSIALSASPIRPKAQRLSGLFLRISIHLGYVEGLPLPDVWHPARSLHLELSLGSSWNPTQWRSSQETRINSHGLLNLKEPLEFTGFLPDLYGTSTSRHSLETRWELVLLESTQNDCQTSSKEQQQVIPVAHATLTLPHVIHPCLNCKGFDQILLTSQQPSQPKNDLSNVNPSKALRFAGSFPFAFHFQPMFSRFNQLRTTGFVARETWIDVTIKKISPT